MKRLMNHFNTLYSKDKKYLLRTKRNSFQDYKSDWIILLL